MNTNENPNIEMLDEAAIDQELEALLNDATITAIADETDAANDAVDVDLEEVDNAANAETLKAEAYADQSDEIEEEENVVPIAAAKKPSAPRPSRAAGAKASDILVAAIPEEELLKVAMLATTDDAEDPSMLDDLKATVDTLAKKVGSKAVNLLRYRSNPKKVEGYTRKALDFLIDKGQADSKELTAHLQSLGYTVGTARSQANQVMALFPALKVADKTGRTLSLRSDSTIVASYQDALSAA